MKKAVQLSSALIATCIALFVIAYALRAPLLSPRISRWVAESIESQFGFKVQIGRISGTYFSSLAVSDLKTVRPNPAGPLISLDLARMEVLYSLPALVLGRDRFIETIRIDIDGAALELSVGDKPAESKPDGRFEMPVLPRGLPRVRISGSSVVVRSPDAWTRLGGITLNSSPIEAAASRIDLSVAEWSWKHPLLEDFRTSLACTAQLTGSNLKIDQFQLADGRVNASASADLRRSPATLPFDATVQIAGGRLRLAGTWTGRDLDLQTSASHLDLAHSLTIFKLPFTRLAGILNGRAEAQLDFDSPAGSKASLELTLAGGRVDETLLDHVTLNARLADERLIVESLTARTAGSSLELSAVQTPLQPLFATGFAEMGKHLSGKFDLQSRDVPGLLRLLGTRPGKMVAVPAHAMRIQGEIGQATLSIHQGFLETADGELSVAALDIRMPTDGKSWRQSAINGTGRVDVRELEPFGALLGQENISGSLKASISLGGTLGAPAGRTAVDGKQISWRHIDVERLAIKASGNTEIVSVESAELRNGRDQIIGRGDYRLSSAEIENARLDLKIADIGHYTRGLVAPKWNASGAVQLEARASGPLSALEATLQADLKSFRIGEIDVASAVLLARSQGRRIRIELAEIERQRQRLKLSASITNNWKRGDLDAVVDMCDIQLEDLDLALARPARLNYSRTGSLVIEGLVLSGPSGEVTADGRLVPQGESNLSLNIRNLSGSAWFEALTGSRSRFNGLNASVDLAGTIELPLVRAAGRVDEIIVRGYPDPLSGSIDFIYSRSGIDIHGLSLQGPTGPDISISGNLPVKMTPAPELLQGPVSVSGSFSIPDLRIVNAFFNSFQTTGGGLKGDFKLSGSWQKPDGSLVLRADSVDLASDSQPLPPGPYTLDSNLKLTSNKLTLQSLRLDSPALFVTGNGRWTGMPSLAALLRPGNRKTAGALAFEGKLVSSDLRWLARQVDSVRRSGGRLEADLRIEGPMLKPDFRVAVRIADGELRPQAGIPSLGDVQMLARLDKDGLELERLDARLGGSPVQARGGLRWDLNAPRAIALSLEGTNLLLYRDESVLLRADTNLRLQGPLDGLVLAGDMALTKGLVKRNLNILGALGGAGGSRTRPEIQLFSLPEPPFSKMRFDVRLTSTSPVEIDGNLAQGALRPDLHLGGTGLIPVLTGKIYADSTRVNLPGGRLIIQSGVIQFLETDPELPVLELNGRSQMLGYDISVQISGPYNEPEITLSSVPPLPNEDLMLLLLTGQPPKGTLGKSGRQRQNIQVAVYVARDILESLFSEDSSEEIEDVLERFDFQIGRNVTRSGDETIEAQFRLANGVILKRDRLFITGEKDAYDYINTGVKLVFRFR